MNNVCVPDEVRYFRHAREVSIGRGKGDCSYRKYPVSIGLCVSCPVRKKAKKEVAQMRNLGADSNFNWKANEKSSQALFSLKPSPLPFVRTQWATQTIGLRHELGPAR